jgi:peptidoglycan/LPS O-acetylase OafA/YrhL
VVERRVRTEWRIRERTRRLAALVAVLGAAVGLAAVAFLLHDALARGARLDLLLLLVLAGVVGLSALLPRAAVLAIGRWLRHRHRDRADRA